MAECPDVPFYALVDFDPDGIAIMSTYKYGSYALAHENVTAPTSRPLNIPGLRWLGIKSGQLTPYTDHRGVTHDNTTVDAQGTMRLTPRDRKKARKMLSGKICGENSSEPEWTRELQRMLMLNMKAEMQILEEQPGGVSGWVKSALGMGESTQG